MKLRKIPRRDRVYLAGCRAGRLTDAQSAAAWRSLSAQLQELGELDIPKFRDVIAAIRSATITAVRSR